MYPHGYKNHYVAEQYLPDDMQGTYFYQPSDVGYERTIKERLNYWRSRDEETDLKKRLDRYIDRESEESELGAAESEKES